MFKNFNINRFKETFVREELIFALDMILSIAASIIVFLGIELVFPDLFHSYELLTYLLASTVASFAFFLLMIPIGAYGLHFLYESLSRQKNT